MKLFVIGSQDAVWGFTLVGVRGRIVTTSEELGQALDEALADQDLGIVLLTQDVADLDRRRVDTLKIHSTIPLLVEIPSAMGPDPEQPSLDEVIRRTIGVRL